MRLLFEIFAISEAGVENEPTAEPKKRRGWPDRDDDDGDKEEVPEFGTDVPDEEPPPEFGSSEEEPEGDEADPEDDFDPRNDRKFASEPQRSAPKAAPAPQGLTLQGDPATLAQLRDALDQLSSSPRIDDDLADWLDECVRAIDMAGRRHEPTVTLPKFSATPGIEDYDDDEGGDDYEEGED